MKKKIYIVWLCSCGVLVTDFIYNNKKTKILSCPICGELIELSV